MATISKLKKILTILEEAGKGEEFISAEHDIVYLLPPGDEGEEETEFGKKLTDAGANYSEDDGWTVFA